MKPERWARIKAIFYDAAEQPADTRAAFVRSRCEDDESMAMEIESLLIANDQAGSFIEGPPNDGITTVPLDLLFPNALIGSRIGAYEVIRLIGRGGMGAVYLAQDTRLGRQVALKLLRDGFTTDKYHIRRFEQEARAASALNHPNIVTIYDIGEAEVGRFIIMEFVEGQTLHEVATKPFSLDALVKMGGQIAKALNVAHSAGIIHRDIKPENIMVRNDGYVKVLDFGVARLATTTAAGLSESASVVETNTGIIIGTPAYMSPEQAGGKPITGATDIFSSGIILYELATGQHPFRRDSQLGSLHAIIEEQPIPPSRLNPEISTTLETLILRMLEKDPRLRPDAGEVDRILTKIESAISKGSGTEAGPPPLRSKSIDAVLAPRMTEPDPLVRITDEEIQDSNEVLPINDLSLAVNYQRPLAIDNQPVWRRPKIRLALLLAVSLTAAITASLFVKPSDKSEIRSVAVLPFKSLDVNDSDPSLGLKLADALIQRLGRLRQIVVRPTRAVQRYEERPLDPIAAGHEQQVDAVFDGSLQRTGERFRVRIRLLRVRDGTQLWEHTFDERSADPFYLQDALAEQTAQAILPQLGVAERKSVVGHDTENAEAHRLYTEGRYYWNRRNIEGIRKSIAYFEQSIRLDPNFPRTYAGLADSYITLSDYEAMPAREAYPKAKQAALKALEIDDKLAEAHSSLAMIKASYEWDWLAADEAFQQAIQLNPNYATAHQWYAEYLAGMGRHEEALAEIRLAQELDPLSLIIRSVEAWVWYYARDFDQMLAHCRRVIEMDSTFGEVYAYLGLAYEQKGMFREAMDAYQKHSTLLGHDKPAAVSIRSAGIADSKDYWRKMVELAKPTTGSDFDAAHASSQLGEHEQALDFLEQAYKKRDYRMMYLKVHPNLDPVRANPRFHDLLRRTGLAQENRNRQ